MKKIISIFVLVSIIFLSSFSMSANYPAPFQGLNEDNSNSCPQGFSKNRKGECINPYAKYNPKPEDITTALSSALVQDGTSVNFGYSSSTPIILDNKPINKTKRLQTEDNLWSEKKICEFTNGCSADKCYPFGYIKDGMYCAGSELGFVEQQHISGEACSYDFQCSSNFCFNSQCVSNYQSLIRDVLVRLYALESKLELDLKEINTDNQVNETVVENLEIRENKGSGFFKRLFR